jgi:prepilin-type N-terminal cleavage/methylation domain-containing protein
MNRPRRATGFTLLELLMATAIMAVLSLTLFSAMRTGFKARDRALATVGPARATEIAMDMVRRDLESAMPPKGVISNAFLGDEGFETRGTSEIRFFTVGKTPPLSTDSTNGGGGIGGAMGGVKIGSRAPAAWDRNDPTQFGGIERVDLLVRADGTLVRRVTRNLLAPTEPTPEEQLLCRGVSMFRVRYFDGQQWADDWDSTQYGDTLPMAVEVSMEVKGSNDPTREAGSTPTGDTTYRATRSFYLPCRDESALMAGGTP